MMKDYRKKLKLENLFLLTACLILTVFQVLAFCRVIVPITGDGHWVDMWNGFIAGASFGLMILFLIGIIVNLRALRNDQALKKLFVKENDERTRQIAILGKSTGNTVFLITGLVAAIVLGYFSIVICVTCICCVFANSMIVGLSKLYYAKKL